MGQGKPCPHCGGEGTCRRGGPQDSCAECIEIRRGALESQPEMHLVACSYCLGGGRFLAEDEYVTCAHCQGSRFCKPNGESPACDFCLESYREELVGKDASASVVMVPCACCQGTGLIKTIPVKPLPKPVSMDLSAKKPRRSRRPKPRKVTMPKEKRKPGRFRFVMAFLAAFFLALTGVLWLVDFLQTESRMAVTAQTDEGKKLSAETLRSDSLLVIHTDHSVTVEETLLIKNDRELNLRVRRELPGNQFFPGRQSETPLYKIQSLLLDGEPFPYRVRMTHDGGSFVLENDKKPLPPGINTLTLTYKLWGLIQSREETYELHWNVTGAEWPMRINQTSVTVGIPLSSEMNLNGIETGGGIGIWGQKDFRVTVDDEANVSFVTTRPLEPKEDFTISLVWLKRE